MCTGIGSNLNIEAQNSMQIMLPGWETRKISQCGMQHHMALLLLVSEFTNLDCKYFFPQDCTVQFQYILGSIVYRTLHTRMVQWLLFLMSKSMICFSLVREMKKQLCLSNPHWFKTFHLALLKEIVLYLLYQIQDVILYE